MARRECLRPLTPAGPPLAAKLTTRSLRPRPVADRLFLRRPNGLESRKEVLGTDDGIGGGGSEFVMTTSSGELGVGGVLDLVVVADLVIEKRRLLLLGGGPPLMDRADTF